MDIGKYLSPSHERQGDNFPLLSREAGFAARTGEKVSTWERVNNFK